MNCQNFDGKEYLLGEWEPERKTLLDGHVSACAACREDVDRLRLTHAALLAVRDEEPPRRIAFVSDKVFEPRWWQRVSASAPAMGFASAALLACAILVHGALLRPSGPSLAAQTDTAAIEAQVARKVEARLNQRVHDAVTESVTQAVMEVSRRDDRKTAELVSAAEKRFADQRRADLIAFDENAEILYKRTARVLAQNDESYATSQPGVKQ